MRALIVSILPLVLLAGTLRTGPTIAEARSPSPPSLALPASIFPRGASVQSGAASNHAADAAGLLHTASYEQLGRVGGYMLTARWTVRSRRRSYRLTVRYSGSRFATAVAAATVYADARSTLWETGSPIALPGRSSPDFLVLTTNGQHILWATAYRGTIEAELSLQYPSALPVSLRTSALTLFDHIQRPAWQIMRRAAAVVALPPMKPLSPGISAAPWGTGPVVKSPSLMALGAAGAPADPDATPGMYRAGRAPGLAARALGPSLAAAGVSRFARVATLPAGEVYDGATLLTSPAAAAAEIGAMAGVDGALPGTQPFDLRTALATMPDLATADTVAAWQRPGEALLLARFGNVIMSLATNGTMESLLPLANGLAATVPSPLHASGTSMENAAGSPVHLAALNWYGTEQSDFAVGGLDARPYEDILGSIAALGYTTIRLPFSNQVVEQNPIVTNHLAANPGLRGLHALDLLDRIVNYAGAIGLSVILDDHRSEAGWSAEENGLWYAPGYPESAFIADWTTMAARYAVNDVVVGADLRNEPHGAASWGDGNGATDWRAAAQRAGDAVLAANPRLLVIVEGVQRYGTSPSYWWGGNLMGVAAAPASLQFPDGSSARSRLVYSVHDYGPDNCGTGCPWFNATTTVSSLSQLWEAYWGYIVDDPSKPYAAPVLVGEFGTCNYQQSCVTSTVPGSQGQWFAALTQYIATKHLSWAYWAANATQSSAANRTYGAVDWYGLFQRDWAAPGPWVNEALARIMADGPAASGAGITG